MLSAAGWFLTAAWTELPEVRGNSLTSWKEAALHSGVTCQLLPTATACSRPVCLSSSSMLFRQLWQTHRGISPRRFFTSFGMKSGGSFSPCNTSPFCEGPSSQPLRSRWHSRQQVCTDWLEVGGTCPTHRHRGSQEGERLSLEMMLTVFITPLITCQALG